MKHIHTTADVAEPEQEMIEEEAVSEQDDFDAVWVSAIAEEKNEKEELDIATGLTDLFNSFDDYEYIHDAKYGEWLGTHMIGANVTEAIAQTVTARKLETTWQEVLDSIHPHPTMSEGVKDAIEVALGEAIHL